MMQDSCSHKPYITDDLYGPAVYPEYRHTGVAHRLMEAYIPHLQGSAIGFMKVSDTLIGAYPIIAIQLFIFTRSGRKSSDLWILSEF